MSSWAVTMLALTLGMPPGPGASGKMNAQRMAAQPLPDEALEKGTVSVLIRGGKVEGVEVILLPAAGGEGGASEQEILAGGKTNAEGRIFLKAAVHGGREVQVLVKTEGGAQRSVPFQVPLLGGVRLLFMGGGQTAPHGMGGAEGAAAADPHSGGHGHAHGAPAGSSRPSGPTTSDPAGLRLWLSFRIMGIEAGILYLGVTYTLINGGSMTFDPGAHGLLLPLPQGHKDAKLSRGAPGIKAEPQGIVVKRPIPTGRHGLQIAASMRLPADRPTLDLRLGSALPIIGFSASLQDYPTAKIRLVGAGLGPPQTMDVPAGHGGDKLLVYRSPKEGFPTRSLSLQITGIPVRSRARSWPFALAALLLLLGGVGLVAFQARQRARAAEASGAPAGGTVKALLDLERDRLLGRLGEEAFQAERRRLLGS